ncbi:uncharacterized protein LOC121948909 isoform X2 [Plectropomus leopardus]|uniref:uncharacterized protein LOC121948909 isoform X2 n=1 Tax=Plectropomus leopardus TaxID=160734 RepID=UPI001C4C78D1|nr:uncharacterized protein LOC121948909 isoform X2 [Plectropomus leopardus]
MQILTVGRMENFCKYLGFNGTFSLICCILWIFSPAEGKTISRVVGSRVILHCKNETKSTLSQLTWKMDKDILFTFNPSLPLYESSKAHNLTINMSLLESKQYALVIDRAHLSHTGNYTCEINTKELLEEQKWELIITEPVENGNSDKLMIAMAATVPCACCLIFIITLVILLKVHKRAQAHSQTAEMVNIKEREEDIYENCLETNQRRGYNQRQHYKPRTH